MPDVRTRTVEYRDGADTLEGFLAWDAASPARRPGIAVFPDFMGVGPESRRRAEVLAGLGYVALVADVFGQGVRPGTREEASALARHYRGDRELLRRRGAAAAGALRAEPHVDGARLAAIGFCFGGTAALELARSGVELAAIVTFHGGLDSPRPEDGRRIRGKVLALHGADDPLVPRADLDAFEAELTAAGVDWQLVKYGHAVHGFTNPGAGSDRSRGLAYDPVADRRSWAAMRALLDEVFA